MSVGCRIRRDFLRPDRALVEAFRGLPITLVYIGVLALAIYGFTGHSVIL